MKLTSNSVALVKKSSLTLNGIALLKSQQLTAILLSFSRFLHLLLQPVVLHEVSRLSPKHQQHFRCVQVNCTVHNSSIDPSFCSVLGVNIVRLPWDSRNVIQTRDPLWLRSVSSQIPNETPAVSLVAAWWFGKGTYAQGL